MSDGERGELLGSEGELRGDLKMIRRAIRQGWIKPYTPGAEVAEELPRKMMEVVNGDDPRAAVNAARVLVAMSDHNLAIAKALDGDAPTVQVNVGKDIEVKLIDADGNSQAL